MPQYRTKEANFRVFLNQRQGGRKYMEDVVMIRDHNAEISNQEFVFWAVFDGHGGAEAAKFAREHLLDELKKIKDFWSTDPDEVSKAIKEAFIVTHKLMWKNVGKWPKTLSGLPSTAGTTASVVLIKDGKIYVAHVGDSSIVIGEEKATWQRFVANCVTIDHKPEDPGEKKRIEGSGGQVAWKAGVPRVVWHRPKPNHKGPVRRSTQIDDIPFLAVARALGDLWSYNSEHDMFVVSPEPDITVLDLDVERQKFIILASDGLWNMVSPEQAVAMVEEMDERDAHKFNVSYNPAMKLVSLALDKWANKKMRADNTSVILAFIDAPGQSPSPFMVSDPQLSNASTVMLSDTESVQSPAESPTPATVNTYFPGINRHRYWDDLFPSPRHIGFGGHISAKHINAITGKTPKMHKHKHHARSKTPRSCPPKMNQATSRKLKHAHMTKCVSSPAHVNGISSDYISSSFSGPDSVTPNDHGASPALGSHKRKASSQNPEDLITRISPLQGSPRRRGSSDCGPSSPKKPRHGSPSKASPITGVSDGDYVSQEVVVSTSDEVTMSRKSERLSCEGPDHQERSAKSESPMVATSAKSPLKVDIHENSPSLGVVSPIWPSCLEKDIDLEAAGSSAMCSITIDTSVGNCVLRENSPKSIMVSGGKTSKKSSYAKINSRHFVGSQNKASKPGYIRRKSPQGNAATRITLHKLRLRSKRPFNTKLRNTQHRTRLQVSGSYSSIRRS